MYKVKSQQGKLIFLRAELLWKTFWVIFSPPVSLLSSLFQKNRYMFESRYLLSFSEFNILQKEFKLYFFLQSRNELERNG